MKVYIWVVCVDFKYGYYVGIFVKIFDVVFDLF